MKVEADQAAYINKILTRSANSVEKDIKLLNKGSKNPITKLQLEAQRAAINAQLAQDWNAIENAITSGKKAATAAASQVVSQYENVVLGQVLSPEALKAIATSEANRAVAGMDAMLQRIGGSSHIPLSTSVYKNKQLVTGWVDAKVNQALVSGWDANRLAKEVKNLIDPAVKGGVPYAANRLARTEINNAFHSSSVERYKKSAVVEGADWNLSGSHPEGDICDDLKADGPYDLDNVPGKPHPFCYCYITPMLLEPDEFLDKLLDGGYGDEPWKGAIAVDPAPTYNTVSNLTGLTPLKMANTGKPAQFFKETMEGVSPKVAKVVNEMDGDTLNYLIAVGKTPAGVKSEFLEYMSNLADDGLDDLLGALAKADAATPPIPTLNELAKTYKIKADVLKKTGLKPESLDIALKSYTPQQLTKLKSLALDVDKADYLKIGATPSEEFLAHAGNAAAKKKYGKPVAEVADEFSNDAMNKKWGVDKNVLDESTATNQQIDQWLTKSQDTFGPNYIKSVMASTDLEQFKFLKAAQWEDVAAVKKTATATTKKAAAKATVEEVEKVAKKPTAVAEVDAATLAKAEKAWKGKAQPIKPVAPKAPTGEGQIAYGDFLVAIKARYRAFAKATNNPKTELPQSNNWSQVLKVVEGNDLDALKLLKAENYVDEELYKVGVAAIKKATAPSKVAANRYAKELAAFEKASASYADDLAEWKIGNGITSSAKGMQSGLVHKTDAEGAAWANKNLPVAKGDAQAAAKHYSGSSYREWNDALRKNADLDSYPAGWQQYTKDLDAAMMPMPEDVIVHRGTSFHEFFLDGMSSRTGYWPPPPPTDLIGSVQTNHGYLSTSVGSRSAFSGTVKIEIMVPQGHKAAWVSPYSKYVDERELLLSRSSNLYIHDVYERGGIWNVRAEVVLEGEDPSSWIPGV